VKTEPTASKKPTLAAVLKDAEARLAETEKRIKPLTEPHPDPAAARNAEAPPVEVETQAAPSAEPHGNPVAAEDVEACQADAEKQPSAKPGIDLAAVLKDTEVRLAEAEKNVAEQADACLRAKAETENVRRRALEDITKASKFAAEKFAGTMLPVKDSLEAALAVGGQTPEKLREGVELTLRQLIAAFESANLVEENPLGQKFDPNKHNAIGMTESEAEPNTVLHVLQKGYLLHGRVIRPAMVMVAKAKKA
jgi:molecular chaperone GrpE